MLISLIALKLNFNAISKGITLTSLSYIAVQATNEEKLKLLENYMNQATIENLANTKDELCVSIFLPTTKMPDRRVENIIRLNNLVGEAKQILGDRDKNNTDRNKLFKKLNEQSDVLTSNEMNAGMAIFVSNSITASFCLPVEVDERVSVGNRFRIKDLLYAKQESINYNLLILTESSSRLYEGFNNSLREIKNGFPLTHMIAESSVEKIQSSSPEPRWVGSGKRELSGDAQVTSGTYIPNMDAIQEERLKQFFRQVDNELTKQLKTNSLPVILLTVEENASIFKDISKNSDVIVDVVHGSFELATESQLAEIVKPALERYKKAQKMCSLAALDTAKSNKTLRAGIYECWYHARNGRVAKLFVERDASISGYETKQRNFYISKEGEAAIDSREVPDAYDELVAKVFSNSGEVTFVEPGTLEEYLKVAAILRY